MALYIFCLYTCGEKEALLHQTGSWSLDQREPTGQQRAEFTQERKAKRERCRLAQQMEERGHSKRELQRYLPNSIQRKCQFTMLSCSLDVKEQGKERGRWLFFPTRQSEQIQGGKDLTLDFSSLFLRGFFFQGVVSLGCMGPSQKLLEFAQFSLTSTRFGSLY